MVMPYWSDKFMDLIENERFRKLLLVWPDKALIFMDRNYRGLLQQAAYYYTHDLKTSEDIVQEILTEVWQRHRELGQPHSSPFLPYLMRMVRNKAITEFKKKRREYVLPELLLPHVAESETTFEARLIQEEVRQELRQLIGGFPKRQRECIMLKLDEGLTNAQIAERLQVSPKAVEGSITCAYKRLRSFWMERG